MADSAVVALFSIGCLFVNPQTDILEGIAEDIVEQFFDRLWPKIPLEVRLWRDVVFECEFSQPHLFLDFFPLRWAGKACSRASKSAPKRSGDLPWHSTGTRWRLVKTPSLNISDAVRTGKSSAGHKVMFHWRLPSMLGTSAFKSRFRFVR